MANGAIKKMNSLPFLLGDTKIINRAISEEKITMTKEGRYLFNWCFMLFK